MKPLVIHHSADFDGLFCREIARKFYGDQADYLGWDYGQPEPVLEPARDLIIMDLSVPSLMAHPRLTWIDHHKTAIEKYPPTIPGVRIDGVAACRLAWQWFYGPIHPARPELLDYVERTVQEPLAVQLAGEYDIWDKRDFRAEVFQHALRSCDLTPHWAMLLSRGPDAIDFVNQLLEVGAALQYAQREGDAAVIKKHGFPIVFEGRRFLALNTTRKNSQVFAAGLTEEHEGCFAFNWTGSRWNVSLYGAPAFPDLDLSPIAKKYGGGGHRQACGFSTDTLPFVQPAAIPTVAVTVAESQPVSTTP
jgi:hypothetical protein